MIFYLKTQGGWRERTEMEHIPAEAAPARKGEAWHRLKSMLDRLAEQQRAEDAQTLGPDRETLPRLAPGHG
jgi:hypothetical protein